MPNGTYGGVRGTETKVGQRTFVSRPTRLVGGVGDVGEHNCNQYLNTLLTISLMSRSHFMEMYSKS